MIKFGETLVGCVCENEPILDEDGNIVDGEIKEMIFASRAELKAYSQGMEDADGWATWSRPTPRSIPSSRLGLPSRP